jgi:hypothetical protein
MLPALSFDDARGSFSIALDEKRATYDRVGYDLSGNWICDLRVGK